MHCLFDNLKNKHDYFKGKDCIRNFCKDLKKHVTKKINNKKKKLIPLTNEENKSYLKQSVCCICQKNLVLIMSIMNTISFEITIIAAVNLGALLIMFVTK